MRRHLVCALLLAACTAHAAEEPPASVQFGALHRFDDDVSLYADPARWRQPWDGLKRIELGDTILSLGGELREKFESERQPGLGLDGLAHETVLLHRLLLHADAQFENRTRLFVQLGNHVQTGRRDGPGPTDVDRADIQQAFVELPLGDALRLRLGRQEIAFGAQRFVSVRESPNVRQSFDGARMLLHQGDLSLDLFATRPYRVRPGAFDDGPNDRQLFWGAYASWQASPEWHFDLYHLGLRAEQVRLEAGRGLERRLAFGARAAGHHDGFDLDADAMLQGGSFAGRPVRAFALSADAGYRPAGGPRFGIKAYVASGDADPTHGAVGTFDPFFPKGAYFSEAAINAASNLIAVGPTLTLQPAATLTLTFSWDHLWRYSSKDAFYEHPFVRAVAGNVSAARDLGDQLQALVALRVTPNVSLGFAYVRFQTGPFLQAAGAKDLDHAGAWIQFRF